MKPTGTEPDDSRPAATDPPPLLGSWRNLYGLVLAELAVVIALFYVLSRWASR